MQAGQDIPWVVLQDSGTRTAVSALWVGLGVLLVAVGAFLAFIGITAGAGLFALLFMVLWGLVFLRLSLLAFSAGAPGLTADPEQVGCTTCQTTWSPAAPPSQPMGLPPQPVQAQAQPPVPAQPAQPPAQAPGPAPTEVIARLEQAVMATLSQQPGNEGAAAALERQRIESVQALGRTGQNERRTGQGDGRDAVAALIRLLKVDTGYVPSFKPGEMKATMAHHVIEQLGNLGDPAAVEPLISVLEAERQLNESSGKEYSELSFKDTVRGSSDQPLQRAGLAEDLFKAAAAALGRLGDPRALPALRDAQEHSHFGMKKAAKQAIKAIDSRPTSQAF